MIRLRIDLPLCALEGRSAFHAGNHFLRSEYDKAQRLRKAMVGTAELGSPSDKSNLAMLEAEIMEPICIGPCGDKQNDRSASPRGFQRLFDPIRQLSGPLAIGRIEPNCMATPLLSKPIVGGAKELLSSCVAGVSSGIERKLKLGIDRFKQVIRRRPVLFCALKFSSKFTSASISVASVMMPSTSQSNPDSIVY
jgi:hypothetical protein